jgi:uracil-DNA glycosylase family 4
MLGPRQSNYVGPEGPKDAKIALVGEAPGAVELRFGRPFVGPAGDLLNQLLLGAGIQRSQCYVTNVIKEKPEDTEKKSNDISTITDLSKKVPIETEAFKGYKALLQKELESTSANIFVAFGNIPLYTLTGIHPAKITKRRGSIYPCTLVEGRKVLACIHPAACLHGPDGKGMYIWKHLIMADLRKAVEESESPSMPDNKWDYIIEPTYDESIEYLKRIKQSAKIISFDIEVVNLEVSCISIATSWNTYNEATQKDICGISMSIPFTKYGSPYFNPDQELEVWRLIGMILQDNSIKKIGQNIIFDTQFLFRKYGLITNNIDDTMIAQAILSPDFPKGLDFITSMYTNEPYYKDDGKQYLKIGGSDEAFWLYNAKDSAVCLEAFPSLIRDIQKMGNEKTYEAQRDLVPILTYMSERGIRMDMEGLQNESARIGDRVSELSETLNRMCGYDINPASPKQLAEYFYSVKGYKPYRKRGTSSVTTDEDALKRLARKGAPEASILLEIRRLSKLKGTYLDVSLDSDGRIRCSYNPVGTETGRLSSSKNIWGTGGNLQNSPPEFLQFMMADDGYMVFEMDLSQAENRLVAYLAPEPAMIETFERGIDVHAKTGSLISGLPIDEVIAQDKEGITCPLGGGRFTWRFWGKKANHGLNYDLGYKTFAFYYEIPENDARYIVTRYHQVYPGVRQYHRTVQAELSKSRALTNLFGRKRLFMDRWGDSIFKEGYAFLPQSTVADKINRHALIPIYYSQGSFGPVELLNQVHDSIKFQIPVSIGFNNIALILMEIKTLMEQPLEYRLKQFTIPVECKVGTRMASYHPENSPLGNMKKVALDGTLSRQLEETWNTFIKQS